MAEPTNEQLIDELQRRVAALYKLNAGLAAQVDRMRPVVEAARAVMSADGYKFSDLCSALHRELTAYDAAMAALVKEGGSGGQ